MLHAATYSFKNLPDCTFTIHLSHNSRVVSPRSCMCGLQSENLRLRRFKICKLRTLDGRRQMQCRRTSQSMQHRLELYILLQFPRSLINGHLWGERRSFCRLELLKSTAFVRCSPHVQCANRPRKMSSCYQLMCGEFIWQICYHQRVSCGVKHAEAPQHWASSKVLL